MEIHAPERPIHGLKDFAVHIAVVTVGILIALGLDGLREAFREHRLIRDTRANIQAEMQVNQEHAAGELARVTAGRDRLKVLLASLPTLTQHPEQLSEGVQGIQNPYYFFDANSWQAALSTGVLAHMSTEEVSAYAGAAESIRIYSGLQAQTMAQELHTIAFFSAHPHPTPEQMQEGVEQLVLFYGNERALAYVCPQMQDNVDRALRASSVH